MKFYVLASLIIFGLTVKHAVKRSSQASKEEERSFWARESQANSVRKQPLDDITFITLPDYLFSVLEHREEELYQNQLENLRSLKEQKIANLSMYTNTELKMRYGVANLTFLSDCDYSFTVLVRTLQLAAAKLYEDGEKENALLFWEFAVQCGSDVTGTYTGLASLYKERGLEGAFLDLKEKAEALASANKSVILRKLNEFG